NSNLVIRFCCPDKSYSNYYVKNGILCNKQEQKHISKNEDDHHPDFFDRNFSGRLQIDGFRPAVGNGKFILQLTAEYSGKGSRKSNGCFERIKGYALPPVCYLYTARFCESDIINQR